MNPFEEILRNVVEKAERKNRFGHLINEQRVEEMMERNLAFWENVKFADVETIDHRGCHMLGLLLALRDMDMAQYHADHFLIDEDEAPRKESKLRCKFWDKHHDMIMAAVKYAEFCGYVTIDYDAIEKKEAEIDARYEALKPRDGESIRAEGPTENTAE